MRVVFGLLLMGASLVACVLLAALVAGVSGGYPAGFITMFFVYWGFGGPIFFLGLFLTAGGDELHRKYKLLFLWLALASSTVSIAISMTLN